MADENYLGVRVATTVAGFVGALVALSAVPPLSKAQAVITVFVGAATAAYGTPAVSHYAGIEAEPVQNGLAFLAGLVSMHLARGILRMAESFQRDPLKFIRKGGKP